MSPKNPEQHLWPKLRNPGGTERPRLEKKAHHFTVVGRVQGVGFRYFVYRHATSLQLCGWVRNKENGDVEAHVEGGQEGVLKLERLIRKGPSFSFVSECRLREVPVEGFETFSIVG